jgi:hypothetical protein
MTMGGALLIPCEGLSNAKLWMKVLFLQLQLLHQFPIFLNIIALNGICQRELPLLFLPEALIESGW